MNHSEQKFYVGEIHRQAVLTLHSYNMLRLLVNQLLDMMPWDPQYQVAFNVVFKEVHSLLTHSSNISKMFWPDVSPGIPRDSEKAKKKQLTIDRGEHLRALYTIQDNSPISSRDLRNHLEHFDDRLDTFLYEAAEKNFAFLGDTYIGPINDVTKMAGGLDEKLVLRHLDPTTLDFKFRGERYDLQVIVNQVQDINNQSLSLLASS